MKMDHLEDSFDLLILITLHLYLLEGYNYKTTKAAFSDLSLARFLTPN